MRTTLVIGFWGAAVLASCGLLAQETFNENAGDTVEGREGLAGQKGAPEPGGAVTRGSPNAETARASAGRWRYRFHNGHWWYYGRGNQWLYWNGAAWAPYNRQTYAQWFNRQFRPSGSGPGNDYGDRRAGTVQREKNDARSDGFGSIERRSLGSVQREKNDVRGGDFGSVGRRAPNTVQSEKNSPRGD